MKGKLVVTIGVTIVTMAVLVGMFYLFVISGAMFAFNSNPPKPEITYGEFPFKLTYELDGEIKTIEDTIVCEFVGFKNHGSAGNRRVWKSYLKSGNEQITLLDLRPLNEIHELGYTMLELYFYGGNAEYYMGDNLGGRWRDAQDFNWVDYMYQTPEGRIGYSGYRDSEAWEKYKIKLISWEPSEPIQNTFEGE